MKKIVHKIDKKTTRVKFVYPKRVNVIKRFTSEEKKEAKLNHKAFKKANPVKYKEGRDELVRALAMTTITPNYMLKVDLRRAQ